ncbi:putative mitochondrial protein [Andalucia godoyi]|uniref:Putative mitochondrial protein n=1 Tax=Andalucia godoyi TaxID=505711 RepID=A0A8K0F4C3_ANDGO|nr:putative mitochondrial protein [Andalucia godoyi]|eukprot:ANDGO_03309.mRNA.1 putative mitochondrial protein
MCAQRSRPANLMERYIQSPRLASSFLQGQAASIDRVSSRMIHPDVPPSERIIALSEYSELFLQKLRYEGHREELKTAVCDAKVEIIALSRVQFGTKSVQVGLAHWDLAACYMEFSMNSQASEHLKAAFQIFTSIIKDPDYIPSPNNRRQRSDEFDDWDDDAGSFGPTAESARKSKQSVFDVPEGSDVAKSDIVNWIPNLLLSMGVCHTLLANYSKAYQCLRSAMDWIAEYPKATAAEGKSMMMSSNDSVSFSAFNDSGALDSHRSSSCGSGGGGRQTGQKRDPSFAIYFAGGKLFAIQGEYQRSLQFFEKAWGLCDAVAARINALHPDSELHASILMDMGEVYREIAMLEWSKYRDTQEKMSQVPSPTPGRLMTTTPKKDSSSIVIHVENALQYFRQSCREFRRSVQMLQKQSILISTRLQELASPERRTSKRHDPQVETELRETYNRIMVSLVRSLQSLFAAAKDCSELCFSVQRFDEANNMLEVSMIAGEDIIAVYRHSGTSSLDATSPGSRRSSISTSGNHHSTMNTTNPSHFEIADSHIVQAHIQDEEEKIFHIRLSLATLHRRDRSLDKAIEVSQQMVQKTEAAFGERSIMTARAMIFLAKCHQEARHFNEARDIVDRTNSIAASLKTVRSIMSDPVRSDEVRLIQDEVRDLLSLLNKAGSGIAGDVWEVESDEGSESYRP